MSRSTSGSPSWFAWERSRSRVSGVTGQRVGHLAHVLDEQQVAQVLEQVGDEPAEVLALVGELLDEREQAGRVARRRSGRRAGRAPPRRPRRAAGARPARSPRRPSRRRAGRASRRRRGSSRARCARRARARRRAPRSSRRRRPGAAASSARRSRGRAKRKVWQRERTVGSIFVEVGRAEDEDEVGRRLLDQLQQRVEGRVRELVRLVEDVDLVAALRPAGGRRGRGSRGCRRSRAGWRRPSRSRRATCRSRS